SRYTDDQRHAYRANRRRTKGARGRRLLRRRGERVERSFAHVCETGGGRRTWIRGTEKVAKYHQLRALAFNLGILMRSLFGIGKPRGLQNGIERLIGAVFAIFRAWAAAIRRGLCHRAGIFGPGLAVFRAIAIGLIVPAR
ncbi:MAG: transposase, partial [Candidatus Sumerlaeota bacterium]|nr:transposase [Candidatus Sumerlaeota bacterium]